MCSGLCSECHIFRNCQDQKRNCKQSLQKLNTVKFRKQAPGLIFGGAYTRRGLSMEGNLRLKIDWARLIVGSKFTVFPSFYSAFECDF